MWTWNKYAYRVHTHMLQTTWPKRRNKRPNVERRKACSNETTWMHMTSGIWWSDTYRKREGMTKRKGSTYQRKNGIQILKKKKQERSELLEKRHVDTYDEKGLLASPVFAFKSLSAWGAAAFGILVVVRLNEFAAGAMKHGVAEGALDHVDSSFLVARSVATFREDDERKMGVLRGRVVGWPDEVV